MLGDGHVAKDKSIYPGEQSAVAFVHTSGLGGEEEPSSGQFARVIGIQANLWRVLCTVELTRAVLCWLARREGGKGCVTSGRLPGNWTSAPPPPPQTHAHTHSSPPRAARRGRRASCAWGRATQTLEEATLVRATLAPFATWRAQRWRAHPANGAPPLSLSCVARGPQPFGGPAGYFATAGAAAWRAPPANWRHRLDSRGTVREIMSGSLLSSSSSSPPLPPLLLLLPLAPPSPRGEFVSWSLSIVVKY